MSGSAETTPRLGLVWAQAEGRVIGAQGGMPWHIPEDLAHFREVTRGSQVVMGRVTWDSLPERFRPLPGRHNTVVTRQEDWAADGAERAASLDDALSRAQSDTVWVIGGGQLYREAIVLADVLEVTQIRLAVDGDTTAPEIDEAQWRVSAGPWHRSTSGHEIRFVRYER
ncbi:MAG: dihydrofolate reductase [Mycetocola sp.]